MNFANIELSKELYELSGWSDTTYWFNFDGHRAQKWEVGPSTMLNKPPAYDLGYLLRKLPAQIRGENSTGSLVLSLMDTRAIFSVGYEPDHTEHIDNYPFEWSANPEDAAAKLAIELFKKGILTKEENDRV